MWPCRRADHGTAMASGLDSGCWQLMNTSSCLTNSSATSGPGQSTAKAPFLCQPGLPEGWVFPRPLQYKDTPGKLWSFYHELPFQPQTVSTHSFQTFLHLPKHWQVITDKCSHHQSHPWQYIWASQNKRLLNYKVTNSRSYKKQGALGPVIT